MSFSPLTEILKKLQLRYPVLHKKMEEAKALNHWNAAVGEGIAKHTRPIRVENGVLRIEVDHPIWKQELHHRKRQIIDRLNELMSTDAKNNNAQNPKGKITDLLFY